MKKIKCFISTIIMFALLVGTQVFTGLADDPTGTISLPTSTSASNYATFTRSGNYSYINFRVNTVYPGTGTDNYSSVRMALYTTSLARVSDTATYSETATAYSKVNIYEGYLSKTTLYMGFTNIYSTTTNLYVHYQYIPH